MSEPKDETRQIAELASVDGMFALYLVQVLMQALVERNLITDMDRVSIFNEVSARAAQTKHLPHQAVAVEARKAAEHILSTIPKPN